MKYAKSAMKYFEKHPEFNGFTHIVAGMGIGILITYPIAQSHPLRFALVFLLLGILGHCWAATHKS